MIGLALSGGGSRAIAFHLGCLRSLHRLGILQRVRVLSTVSGGSVIGGLYAYAPSEPFEAFEKKVRLLLTRGLEFRLVLELLKPWNLLIWLTCMPWACVCDLAQWLLRRPLDLPSGLTTTDLLARVLRRDFFPSIRLRSPRRGDMQIVFGSCDLRTGTAFRFGNEKSGGTRYGELMDGEETVGGAVASSAAYPLALQSLNRKWSFAKNGDVARRRVVLTDGGVYDNLGFDVFDPRRDPSAVHAFSCDYLIVCNAGHGQEDGKSLPRTWIPRVWRSFETIHRRVQNYAMHYLHRLKEDGQIKGFILPYLGQIDDRLPSKPPDLIPREDVVGYGTNFRAMPDDAIEKLSQRGEQLTEILVRAYLPELIAGA